MRHIAQKYSLNEEQATREEKMLFKESDIDCAMREYFSEDRISELKRRGFIPLSPNRVKRMTAPIHVTTIAFSSKKSNVRLVLEFTAKNQMPLMSINVWKDAQLRLFGGFIKVHAGSREEATVFYCETLRALTKHYKGFLKCHPEVKPLPDT